MPERRVLGEEYLNSLRAYREIILIRAWHENVRLWLPVRRVSPFAAFGLVQRCGVRVEYAASSRSSKLSPCRL